jgi:hypothetical protein
MVCQIHGTNAPKAIGQVVSSGCLRLVTGDVIDLYRHACRSHESGGAAPIEAARASPFMA